MRSKTKHILQKCIVVFLWLIIWQMVSLFVHNKIMIAGPVDTIKALLTDVVKIDFWKIVGISLLKIMAGLLGGLLIGFLLALISYRIAPIRLFLEPVMAFAKSVPVASFTVILLIWWGSDSLSVAISFLVSLPLMYVNILEGLGQCDKKLLEMAKVFSLSSSARAWYLYGRALKPFLSSGLKIGVGMSIKAGVAAEVIGTPKWSIGNAIYESKIYLETDHVFAWTIVVIVLGVLCEKILLGIFEWISNRKPSCPMKEKGIHKVDSFSLNNVQKKYGDKVVLPGITKTFCDGEIDCLMAPSGTGKTTLLHILAGLLEPDEGEIANGPAHVGMVFQENRLLEGESALKNVELAAKSASLAKEILTKLLPNDAIEKEVTTLSGGMKRRVAIARALAAEAEVLIMDEPFQGLDAENRKKVADVILEHRNGKILIISTHNEEDMALFGAKQWKIS